MRVSALLAAPIWRNPCFSSLPVKKTKFQSIFRAIQVRSVGLLLLNGTLVGYAGIEVLTNPATSVYFGNKKEIVRPQVHNPEPQVTESNLRFRLYQETGSTLMPLGEIQPWKKLTLASNQTVLETLEVELPAVRGATNIRIVWYDGDKKLGMTRINVFPSGLLKPLEVLAGSKPLGLLDPEGWFKSTLNSFQTQQLKESEDLTSADTQLILIAPMTPENRPAGLTAALKKKAADGCAIVWIQPESVRGTDPLPDAYIVNEGPGKIVIATAATVANLPDSPQAQLNLVRLTELATGKKQLELPPTP